MKIKIKHLGSTVEIKDQKSDNTSINAMVFSAMESIVKHQRPPEDPNKRFRDVVTDVCERLLSDDKFKKSMMTKDEFFEAVKPDNEIKVGKKQAVKIHRDASECLKMLNYWNGRELIEQRDHDVHIDSDIAETNTMKVVKSFLNELIIKFPNK